MCNGGTAGGISPVLGLSSIVTLLAQGIFLLFITSLLSVCSGCDDFWLVVTGRNDTSEANADYRLMIGFVTIARIG